MLRTVGLSVFVCLVAVNLLLLGAAATRAADNWPTIDLKLIAGGFSRPIHVTHANDGSGRLFVVEKQGIVKIVRNGESAPTPFLDITGKVNSACSECGLLSIAFPPSFATDRVFFVSYTAKGNPAPSPFPGSEPDGLNDSVIARYRLTENADVADANSEARLLVVNQPFPNHNGGLISFGPDGFLYVGLGDGGDGGDPLNAGQRTDTLLGKLLRIEVGATGTYTIPATNPFVNTPAIRPEIWASGLRNPWRFSFDRTSGDLYLADVGQNLYEEVNVQPASSGGENYGWRIAEGMHCYTATPCDTTGLTAPIWEYGHDVGNSVTGGFVYRGDFKTLAGIYLVGDFGSGRIWGLRRQGSAWENTQLLATDLQISSFGEDETGELYVLDYAGALHQVVDPTYQWPFNLHLPLIISNIAEQNQP